MPCKWRVLIDRYPKRECYAAGSISESRGSSSGISTLIFRVHISQFTQASLLILMLVFMYTSGKPKAQQYVQVLQNRRSLPNLSTLQSVLTLPTSTAGEYSASPKPTYKLPQALAPLSVCASACLAMVFNALPSLNHAIWLSLNVCCSVASHTLPSLGCTLNVKGLPTANCVHMTSTLSSGLILS